MHDVVILSKLLTFLKEYYKIRVTEIIVRKRRCFMEEIRFPYTNSMTSVDLCLLLAFIGTFDDTEIIGINFSDSVGISTEYALKRLEKIKDSESGISRKEDGTFCVSPFSEIYLVLLCILSPDEVINFSNCSFKGSSERVVLYVKKFKGVRLFLSVYQKPDENVVAYQLDCDSSYSAVFIMNIMQQQYIPKFELQDKLYRLFQFSPEIQDCIYEGVECFVSMQVFSLREEKSQAGNSYDVIGLFYIIGFENNVSGVFEYMTEENIFSECLMAKNTEYAEQLAKWLKERYGS
mgnify:CR=1 FL=1